MDIPSVKRQVAKARADGIAVRGLVFINPGTRAELRGSCGRLSSAAVLEADAMQQSMQH